MAADVELSQAGSGERMRRTPAFPKPRVRHSVAVRVYRDGREVCNLQTKAGRSEYRFRIEQMLLRKKHLCCLCHKPLRLEEATFEHQDGRGMGGGHRDDRIEVDGKPINGAAHGWCNSAKGSRRMNYNAVLSKEVA